MSHVRFLGFDFIPFLQYLYDDVKMTAKRRFKSFFSLNILNKYYLSVKLGLFGLLKLLAL